ncbi:MAG: SapC family protein [Pseudomonadota bacterium]
MRNIQAISRDQHGDKRWHRPTNFSFAAADNICPLVLQELPIATMSLPLGFIKAEDHFSLVAVQGLELGKNLYVDANGRWVAGYIPAAYRGYPFMLANGGDGKHILCIVDDSKLISISGSGEPFFDEEGKPAATLTSVLEFLTSVVKNREATIKVCELLARHELLQPWQIKLQRDEGEQNINGLLRVDEARLNAVSAEVLQELRDTGALHLAYCQLLSMQHLKTLANMFVQNSKAKLSLPSELNLDFLRDGGNISFGE